MTDIFDGDPLIILDGDGAEMIFNAGQPVMDQGFLNHVNISALTKSGHWSEDIEPLAARRPTGEYLKAIKKPITRQSLIDSDRAIEYDVQGDEFGSVEAESSNPASNNINTELLITLPTRDRMKLSLERTGQNWISQRDNPKNEYINT